MIQERIEKAVAGDSIDLIAVCGTPRGGTTYLSDLLTAGGRVARHERRWREVHGQPAPWAGSDVEVSWLAWREREADMIVHLVRPPLDSVRSLVKWDNQGAAREAVRAWMPWLQDWRDQSRFGVEEYWARFWLEWTEKCEWAADERLHLVDLRPERLAELFGGTLEGWRTALTRTPRANVTRRQPVSLERVRPRTLDALLAAADRLGTPAGSWR